MGSKPPAPYVYGLPEQFTSWRKNQWESVLRIVKPETRFTIPVCPTGFGKSLSYIASAVLTGKRTCILTSTKALQDQLERDFHGLVAVIKGRRNYKCRNVGNGVTCDRGACTFGVKCVFKETGGCEFYDALKLAAKSQIVVTNYHFWMASERMPGGVAGRIGVVNLLVCDEAHDTPETIAGLCTATITEAGAGIELLRTYSWDKKKVFPWIQAALAYAKDRFKEYAEGARAGASGARKQAHSWRAAVKELVQMDRLYDTKDPETNLVVSHQKDHKGRRRLRVAPIWPLDIAQEHLFQDIEQIVLTSATVRVKTAQLLGIEPGDMTLFEYPHTFPVLNRRVLHTNMLPEVRVNRHTDSMGMMWWVKRGDRIMKEYEGHKGIWHTVSYARQRLVMESSKNGDRLFGHDRGNADERIRIFKRSAYDNVLVSPRVTTGYDFPGKECRFQIIGKIPYPDTRDDIMRARCKQDKNYAPYHAMQTLVQATGRGTRSGDDWCDSWIIDDNAKWFIRKYDKFAPKYFIDAYRSVDKVFLINR